MFQARAANCAALERLQHTGVTKVLPGQPQRWGVVWFEHRCDSHDIPGPHGRNIVISNLTTGFSAPA